MLMDIQEGIGILAAVKSNPCLYMIPRPLEKAISVFLQRTSEVEWCYTWLQLRNDNPRKIFSSQILLRKGFLIAIV